LRKQGWKPKRTIIYAAWDGEEPMLLGLTEWAEEHADELRQHAVAYINTDGNGRGYLMLEGSHTLEHFMNGVARDVQDPESGVSVWQRDELHSIAQAKSDEDRKKIRDRADLRMGALGSGTDYTTFVDHLGVASLNLGYGGEDQDAGIYHSIYDDFYWYTHFSDTSFAYGRALSQTVGTAVMRLADADLLPFDFTDFSDTMQLYLTQLKKLAQDKRSEAVERDRELDEGLFHAINDPRRPTVAPPREPVPPYLNFAPLENAVAQLNQSAQRYQEALQKAWASPQGVPAATLADLNQKMMESERRLTDDAGLPRRPWYKHMIYAPGVYTGYGVKTMPGVREAIEQKRWPEADAEIIRISKVLENESGLIDSATAELTGTR
jgi:N-acetylated-alpha-linked acidic dipeptidase